MSVDAERVKEVFADALALPPGREREASLAGACGGDAELRAEAERLLRAHDAAGDFLAAPEVDASAAFARITDGAGTRIGHYRIVELLGEGGFGSVFLAEQERPVRRQVALKIIKLGMDTGRVIARFEAERQTLAALDHPGIARVLDAGATDAGRPYFVMELIRGAPVTEHCDARRLGVRERLDLFVAVCRAVQHAHQKGVIHRDLKPSNVLVADQDGADVPKVIDFGIAKATRSPLTPQTLHTEQRHSVGTLHYMSPEQARLNDAAVDTRTDVYSLGVLLYELLAGVAPFDPEALRDCGFDEVCRVIREVEPPRPSARVAAVNGPGALSVAERRGTDPAALSRLLRGELDWVVMRCLEKDPARRYDSVGDLAGDVGRYLDNRPVQARPTTAAYRLRKAMRRHRAAFLSTAVAVCGLLAGLGAATYGLVQARDDRDAAVRAAAVAEAERGVAERQRTIAGEQASAARRESGRASAISGFLEHMLAAPRPDRALGRPLLVRDALNEAARSVDNGSLRNQPDVEVGVRHTLGRTYYAMGEYGTSEGQLRAALETARRLCGEEHPLVADLLSDLGRAIGWQGRRAEAERIDRQVLAMQRKLRGDRAPQTATAMASLAVTLTHLRRYDEAEPLVLGALAILRDGGAGEGAEAAFDLTVLGVTYEGRDRHDEAVRSLREGLALQRRLYGERQPALSHTLHNLGVALLNKGDRAGAEAALRESLAIKREALGPAHPDLESTLGVLGGALEASRDLAALEPVLLEHYAWWQKSHPGEPGVALLRRLATLYDGLGKPDRAKAWREALRGVPDPAFDRAVAEATDRVRSQPLNPWPLKERAALYARYGRFAEAAADHAAAIDLDPSDHSNWYLRGCLLAFLDDRDAYKEHCRAMLERFAGTADPCVAERTAKACMLLPGLHDAKDTDLPQELADRASAAGGDADLRAWFSLCRGMALYRRGAFAEAEVALKDAATPDSTRRGIVVELFIAMSCHRTGRTGEALDHLHTAVRRIDSRLPSLDGGNLQAVGVDNWLVCQVVLREAEQVLGTTAAALRSVVPEVPPRD